MADATASNSSVANSSSWVAFVKSLASFNGDLASLTAPPFILSAKSLTEFSTYWCEHPALFVAPSKEADAETRMVLVLKWFLSTLKQQYASRSEKYGNEKKPLNPFLGELFLGKWEDAATGTTELVSEQVSHHPPATAYSITNLPSGVHLEGYNAQKATFKSTIQVKQIGHAVLTVPVAGQAKPDTYLITLPSLHIEGLVFGAPFVELDSATYIVSSTGYSAKVDYAGKGWLSGKKNTVNANIYKTGKDKEVLYFATGQWTKGFEIHQGINAKAPVVATYDAATTSTTPLTVAPVEQQHPLESRRAWSHVAAAIAKGDLEGVGAAKTKIETAQREARKKEEAEGRDWERRYFSTVPATQDSALLSLGPAASVSANGDSDKTGGLWRYDAEKAAAAKQKGALTAEEVAEIEKTLLGQ